MAIINTVVALGMFDGLHRGHREILNKTLAIAKERGLVSVATTFSDEIVEKKIKKNGFLYDEKTRVHMLKAYGIDRVEVFPANDEFLSLSKEDFLHYFTKEFQPKVVVMGKDFTFGSQGSGTAEYISEFYAKSGMEVIILPLKEENGVKISTSSVKTYLLAGEIESANTILVDNFFLAGTVVPGRGEGRKNDIPTANFYTKSLQILPKEGVYHTHTFIDGKKYVSITNVGEHPTYDDIRKNVETHLLNCSETLYGKEIRVEFLRRLRDIHKFSSPETLKIQIMQDIMEVQNDEIRRRG